MWVIVDDSLAKGEQTILGVASKKSSSLPNHDNLQESTVYSDGEDIKTFDVGVPEDWEVIYENLN